MKTLDMKAVQMTIKNLEKNNMLGFYCETKEEALEKVLSLINEGDTETAKFVDDVLAIPRIIISCHRYWQLCHYN